MLEREASRRFPVGAEASRLPSSLAARFEVCREVQQELDTNAWRWLSPEHPDAQEQDHPEVIDPYRIVEVLGEGGMGVVYLAEETGALRRQVALKVIKLGMDTKEVIARFEAERQALAMLDHANIARVYGAGATEDGRPYFAMECVRGTPITHYCDKEALPIPERLRLFKQVCLGTHHAHAHGIIHRDIKPGNVLVSGLDGEPVAKMIDFGIAKATDHRLTEKTIYTEVGRVVGTPAYMSPEQAEMSGKEVDPRSDIYSLGVLLYQLLVGELPFEGEFSKAAFDEIVRRIREDDPSAPSTRWTRLSLERNQELATRRDSTVAGVRNQVRGDLDWVCLKAMEKEPRRRYQTALQLAGDIDHYLNGEPVTAGPPSARYRVQKFARKHRSLVTAASVVFVSLALGVAVSSTLYFRAKTNGERAETHLKVARQNLYLSDVNGAQQDWKSGNIRLMLERLERHVPSPGEADLRDWEWYYLHGLLDQGKRMTIVAHAGSVSSIRWSLDGRRILSQGWGDDESAQEVKVWDAATGSEIWRVVQVETARVSADASLLAAIHTDGAVKVWDIHRQMVVHTFPHAATWLRFSPDGRRLATVAQEGIKVWDVVAGTELYGVELPNPRVATSKDLRQLAWSPDGRWLALGVDDAVRVSDADDGTEVVTLLKANAAAAGRGDLRHLTWTPDGRWIVTVGLPSGGVEFWDTDTWLPEPRFAAHLLGSVSASSTWSPDGEQMALWAPGTERIHVVDVTTSKAPLVLFGHAASRVEILPGQHGQSLAWSVDGELASAGNDGTVKIWDASNGEPRSTLRGHRGRVDCLSWTADGSSLASGGSDGFVKIWDPGVTPEHVTQAGRQYVRFSADGQYLAVRGHGRVNAILYDAKTLEERLLLRDGEKGSCNTLSWHPAGHSVVGGGRHGKIRVWDISTGTLRVSVPAYSGEFVFGHVDVNSVEWSPDGRHVASASNDRTVKLWDPGTWTALRTWTHEDKVLAVTWHPDSRRVASSTRHELLTVWDAVSGEKLWQQKVARLEDRGSLTNFRIAWSHDGERLAVGASAGQVLILDGETGEELRSVVGHGAEVTSVCWSPGDRRLASGGEQGAVKIWDPATGDQLLTFQMRHGTVRSLAWSPDGMTLAAAGSDFQVWATAGE